MAVLIRNGIGVGGNEVGVELTKAEYDELETHGKVRKDVNYYIKDYTDDTIANFVGTSTEYESKKDKVSNGATVLFTDK